MPQQNALPTQLCRLEDSQKSVTSCASLEFSRNVEVDSVDIFVQLQIEIDYISIWHIELKHV